MKIGRASRWEESEQFGRTERDCREEQVETNGQFCQKRLVFRRNPVWSQQGIGISHERMLDAEEKLLHLSGESSTPRTLGGWANKKRLVVGILRLHERERGTNGRSTRRKTAARAVD